MGMGEESTIGSANINFLVLTKASSKTHREVCVVSASLLAYSSLGNYNETSEPTAMMGWEWAVQRM